MTELTTKQKIMRYLKRCKTFKTTKTIAERTGCNYNTVRRCLSELNAEAGNLWNLRIKDNREASWRLAA